MLRLQTPWKTTGFFQRNKRNSKPKNGNQIGVGVRESVNFRRGYKQQFQNLMKLLCMIVFPCFAAECLYKIWCYVPLA
ncbi:hypothetical protein CerSpe_158940 [Prunus speciosa]